MVMTADRLLAGLKRRISIPQSQVLFGDSDILAVGDDIIKGHLVPILISLRQDYFVTSSQTATVADQGSYAVPYRAVGRGLRDLKMVDSSGTTRDLALIQIEDEHRFSGTTTTHSFYFKGDKVVVVPAPDSATSYVEFWWEQPPGSLVTVSSACLVSGITNDTITSLSVPSTMSAAVSVDFIKGVSGNATIGMDTAISSATGTTIAFATDAVPTDLEVGDYISLATTSPVIQLPDECYPLLESLVAKRILMALGDYDGARMLDDTITTEDKNLKQLLEPRIQGEPTIIINRSGLLRGRRFMARRGLLF